MPGSSPTSSPNTRYAHRLTADPIDHGSTCNTDGVRHQVDPAKCAAENPANGGPMLCPLRGKARQVRYLNQPTDHERCDRDAHFGGAGHQHTSETVDQHGIEGKIGRATCRERGRKTAVARW